MKLGFYCLILLSGLFDHFQLKRIGNHGKILHPPLLIAGVVALRIRQFHQMAQPPGYYVAFSLNGSIYIFSAFQHAGNVTGHRRLFSNYQRFHASIPLKQVSILSSTFLLKRPKACLVLPAETPAQITFG